MIFGVSKIQTLEASHGAKTIAYSKKLSRDRKCKEEELNLKYQALLKVFQDNPCETTRFIT